MQAIQELGYEKPSPIQAEALPILLGASTDFLGLAATGTGKTAAFAIPMLERIDASKRGVQALVLCPTRELAIQVAGQITLLGKHLGVRALPVYGGAGYGDQIHGLKSGVQVVVGTPGRLIDHMDKGTFRLDQIKTLILDEADEMISMGFKDELETILEGIPADECNTWLFSATMSPDVRRVADKYLADPEMVQINRTEMIPQTVEQIYYATQESNKPEVLCKLIEGASDDFYGLIFCQTKALVVDLTNYLKGRAYQVDCLHGDMDQNARERTMRAFRERKVTILICTDVASRGLDVKDVTHVINYSIPRELDSYVHRIGRTGRSGRNGLALSLVTASQRGLIGRIERVTKSRMKEGRIPTRKEIGALKISKTLASFQDQPGFERAVELLGTDWKEAIAGMPGEEIVGRFLVSRFPEIFSAEREREAPAPRGEGRGQIVLGKRSATGAPIPRPSAEGRAIAPVGASVVSPVATAALAPLPTPSRGPVIAPAGASLIAGAKASKKSLLQLETLLEEEDELEAEAPKSAKTYAGKAVESVKPAKASKASWGAPSKAPWGARDAKSLESKGGFAGDFKGEYKVKKPRWDESRRAGGFVEKKPWGAPAAARGEKRAWSDKPRYESRDGAAGGSSFGAPKSRDSGYGAPKGRWAKPAAAMERGGPAKKTGFADRPLKRERF